MGCLVLTLLYPHGVVCTTGPVLPCELESLEEARAPEKKNVYPCKVKISSQMPRMCKTVATGRKPHEMKKQMYHATVPGEYTKSGDDEELYSTSSVLMARGLNTVLKERDGVRLINSDDIKDYFNRRARTKQIARKLEGVDLRRAW